MKTKKVNIRELQHNFATYLELAKVDPITVTKYGEDEILLVNPEVYEVTPKKKTKKQMQKEFLESGIFGMYKDRKDWKGKSSFEIAKELRRKAWYGE